MTLQEARCLHFSSTFTFQHLVSTFSITNKCHFSKYFICCEQIFLKYSFHMIFFFPKKHDGFALKSNNILTDENTL